MPCFWGSFFGAGLSLALGFGVGLRNGSWNLAFAVWVGWLEFCAMDGAFGLDCIVEVECMQVETSVVRRYHYLFYRLYILAPVTHVKTEGTVIPHQTRNPRAAPSTEPDHGSICRNQNISCISGIWIKSSTILVSRPAQRHDTGHPQFRHLSRMFNQLKRARQRSAHYVSQGFLLQKSR